MLLQQDQFDMNFAGSDEEDESNDEGKKSDDESSNSESEDDLKMMQRRIQKKARFAKCKLSALDSDDSDDNRPGRTLKQCVAKELKWKINGKDKPEVESLIKQLNTMSIDDPGYAALVFRALKLDPDVKVGDIRFPLRSRGLNVTSTILHKDMATSIRKSF